MGSSPDLAPARASSQSARRIITPEPHSASPETPRRRSLQPSLLVVGSGELALPGLEQALQRHGVAVQACRLDVVVDAVVASAPDLILLVGDAARDCGEAALSQLTSSPLSSVVPVALLDDNPVLDQRLRAFRHGAAAVIARSASVDAMAQQIARLAREIPERGSELVGIVGEATLHEFVSALGKQLRTGILSVSAGTESQHESVRLVLGSGRPLAEFLDDFVARVRRHVVLAEPLRYEFDERAAGTVQLLDTESGSHAPEVPPIRGLRLALADDDAARADSVTQELRQDGASLIVSDLSPSGARLLRLRQADPAVLLLGESHLQGEGYELIRRMRRDTRLRWVSLLIVRWDDVWTEQGLAPGMARLKKSVADLAEPERLLSARAEQEQSFETRLEVVGPARTLRALSAAPHSLRVTIESTHLRVNIDLSNGLVVGALGQTLGSDSEVIEGPLALAAVLALSAARMRIERVAQPATTNIMATVDVALGLADAETPGLRAPAANLAPALEAEQLPSLARQPTTQTAKRSSRLALRLPERISVRVALLLVAVATLASTLLVLLVYLLRTPSASRSASATSGAHGVTLQRGGFDVRGSSLSGAVVPASTVAPRRLPVASLPRISEPTRRAPICGELAAPARKAQLARASQAVHRARRELMRGDLDAAQAAYCVAHQLDRAHLEALTGMSRLLLLRRDARAAVEWARRAEKLRPRDRQIQALLGDGLARLGQLEPARRAWLTALGKPGSSDVDTDRALARHYVRLARGALKNRDSARAERFFRRAALLDPESADAAAGLARALVRIGDKPAAAAWAERARLLAPDVAAVHVSVGDVLVQAGERSQAEYSFRRALELEPDNQRARARILKLERTR